MKQILLDALPPRIYLQLKRWDYKRTHESQFSRLQKLRTMTTDDGYSYKPLDERRAIFVHIPKCGGVSINKAIYGCLGGGHATLDEYLNVFEPACILSYFKFSVVRNPWSRLVSAYSFLSNGGFGRKDSEWFSRELGEFRDFDDFVRNWVNRRNIWKWPHFRPQYHYILEKHGKVQLDFIGFLENISRDFLHIADRVNVKCALYESNKSKHLSYLRYYNNETKNIVADAYAEDIRMLDYTFDNSNLEKQVARRDSGKTFPFAVKH